MSARSLNKVMLIGNLTRDPELRYTPSGSAVCSIGLATNRYWTTDTGEKREETEFHRIVAWNKLAELCSQLLTKGRKIYVEGRLQTRSWTGQDGANRTSTEIVIEDMIILDSRPTTVPSPVVPAEAPAAEASEPAANPPAAVSDDAASKIKKSKKPAGSDDKPATESEAEEKKEEEINPDDIPF